MRWLAVPLLLCSLPALGCQQPLHVLADGNVAAEATVNAEANVTAEAHVTADLPPVSDAGPVLPKAVSGNRSAGAPAVAVVDVDGLLLNSDFTGLSSLGENPVSLFRERLEAVARDSCVCAVVVRVNSPGGGVTACDIMRHDLRSFKSQTGLPVIACLMDLGAGGAYYLATAADLIVAHPTTVTGGIGVILNLYNLQDAMAQFNIVGVPVKAGENIDLGTPLTAMTDERRAVLQSMANEFHERFRQVVLEARPAVDPQQQTTFDGRVFTAAQAQKLHLIDQVGYLDQAIGAARQRAGVDSARVVFYHRRNDPAWSPYSVTANVPLHNNLIPLSLPGLDRSRLPSFLYLWQPEPTLEKLSGR